MGISFSRAPVNEVVVGRVFVPRADLLIPYIGEFWSTHLQNDYPSVEHAVPIASRPDELPFCDPHTGAPLPRVWFIASDPTRLVQLQQDRIYANWRQRAATDQYVRFPTVRDEAIRVLHLFDEYITKRSGTPTKPVRYELTYVNVLRSGQEYHEVADLGRSFLDFGWKSFDGRFLPKPNRLGVRMVFSMPNETGSLTVTADPARNHETGEEIFRLQLAAVAPPEVVSRVDFPAWLEVAHEQIVRGFKDLTTPEAHTYWGLVQEAGHP